MIADTDQLVEEIKLIKERNTRVEADKAWETSWFRKALITGTTYVIAALALWSIGSADPLLGAFIPSLGYFLSTQSFPFIKRWWIEKFLSRSDRRIETGEQ